MNNEQFINELNIKMAKDNNIISIIIKVFLVLLVLFIICIFIGRFIPAFITTIIDNLFIGVTFFGGVFIIWKKFNNKFYEEIIKYVKGEDTSFKPYILSHDRFELECMNGLLGSYIKINNGYYYMETQLKTTPKNGPSKDNIGDCYINKVCLHGLDNFMNCSFDGTLLKDFNEIQFITYFNGKPEKYFERNNSQ